jgi:putative transposase
MARLIRIEYTGAIYNVMSRGNHGQTINASDEDRRLWPETVGEAGEKAGWWIHAYVIKFHNRSIAEWYLAALTVLSYAL